MSGRPTTGLIIGKFLPPHRGHKHLIDSAADRCDELTVVLLARSDDPVPFETRMAWLCEIHPGVRVVGAISDHQVDFEDDATWRYWVEHTLELFDRPEKPDVVFSSEDYGWELAERIGTRHEPIDVDRSLVPISGTDVRRDPGAAWEYLEPVVRSAFVRRVAIVGAESTGKTTLAERLAAHFDTVWVPEYGREYADKKVASEGADSPWRTEEFVHIAHVQREWEDEAARRSGPVLICDTDALATGVWHELYVGSRCPEVEGLVGRHSLYLFTQPDVPWVDDGTRDRPGQREWMTERFRERLAATGTPTVELAGEWAEREAAAVAAIAQLLSEPAPLASHWDANPSNNP